MDDIAQTAQPPLRERPSPITVEIVRGALSSAQLEMGTLIERTAMSPIIREKHDYFCGLIDRDCNMLIGTTNPSGGRVVQAVLAVYKQSEMRPGDIYLFNDCYGSNGSVSHSPDMVFINPLFVGETLVGYAFAWAHFLDIGGSHPGSITPDATSIFQEGIIVPPVRLCRDGQINDDIMRLFVRNSRFPDVTRGDTRSLIAAVQLGGRRLVEIVERFGLATAEAAFATLIDQTTQVVRRRLNEVFPPGRYRFADYVDEDGMGTGPIAVRMTLEAEKDHFVLDVTDSDDQTRGPVNFLMSKLVPGMVLGLYMTSDTRDFLPNEGMNRVIDEMRARPGSVLQPIFPAPLGQRAATSRRVHTTCFGLISSACPDRAHASSSAYSLCFLSGQHDETGKPFLKTMGLAAGQGARSFADGIDAVYYIAQQNYPVEFAEQTYPLRIHVYGIHRDSGGPGKLRGGCGIVRTIELLAESAVLTLRMTNVKYPPFGLNGGMNGRPGRFVLNLGKGNETPLPSLAQGIEMRRGDVLTIETPGGGGCGHPFDRDPAEVLRDVLRGFVSVQSAHDDYGVIVDPDHECFDAAATESLRRNARWPTKLVHRERYYDNDEWYEALGATRRAHHAHGTQS